jgi:hypothetical protein
MAYIRRIAGEPAISVLKKAEMIENIMTALKADDPEVTQRVKAAFDA